MLNEVIRFNAVDDPRKQAAFPQYKYPNAKWRYAQIADYLRIGGTTDEDKIERLVTAIDTLKNIIKIPKTLSQAGIPRENFYATLDDMSQSAFDDQCTGTNPRYPLICEIKQMYINAYEGTPVKTSESCDKELCVKL